MQFRWASDRDQRDSDFRLSVRRTVGMNGTRLSAVLRAESWAQQLLPLGIHGLQLLGERANLVRESIM